MSMDAVINVHTVRDDVMSWNIVFITGHLFTDHRWIPLTYGQ